ncbi:odorant receptor 59b [Pectinophora gossypiella]|uniref:odorant receptor 59b n=1 Tax=Pectinophora gossypiella TaxID=13191 RepID=UPI00214EEFDD|nr:odorant receptor 59b [Pectinophora gossypiella]
MILAKIIRKKALEVKGRFKENSVDNLIWLVNFVPSLAGFSLYKEKVSLLDTPYWIIHIFLLIYVYGVGNLEYQIYHAQGAGEFIKSYVNISLLIFIANSTYWFLNHRPILYSVLKKIKLNDEWAQTSPACRKKHNKLMGNIKIILMIFYGCNYLNASFIYLPHRVDVNNEFSMTPCVGLEPLSESPNREVCLTILCFQELSIMTVVLNFQALLCFLIDHTAAMYLIMSEEMLALNSPDVDNEYVKKKLPSIIKRHVLTLETVDSLKRLYSVPIGINFGSNAVCISLFFYLPLEQWLGFIPILVYCFLVFFLYCFLCQRLINAAEVFENSIYACGWESFAVQERKAVYVMLLLSQKKVEILAADIVPVNIYTFATTLQAMFKFVTVVKF